MRRQAPETHGCLVIVYSQMNGVEKFFVSFFFTLVPATASYLAAYFLVQPRRRRVYGVRRF